MGTQIKKLDRMEHDIQQALGELETLTDQIRVKLHLANMDAKDMWADKLEPKFREARVQAREAGKASRKVIDDTIQAFKAFSDSL